MSPLKTESNHLTNMKLFHCTFIPFCVFHAVQEMSKFESQILCVFSSHNIHIRHTIFTSFANLIIIFRFRRSSGKCKAEN